MSDPRDILGERDAAYPERPTRVAEPSRTSTLPKRFYKTVGIVETDGRFCVALDGKSVRTPGRNPLAVGQRTVADIMATEWSAQESHIDPMTMPMTRLINTALDGVATDMQAVREDIVRYAGTDMLCYQVREPQGLRQLQMQKWSPVLDWALGKGMNFSITDAIGHVQQPSDTITIFGTFVSQVDDPAVLTALHLITSLTGSAIIALAVLHGFLDATAAWDAAHVDEDWNISNWGTDEEAAARRAGRFKDMTAAVAVIEAAE